jgi:hypothetical protein
MCMHMYMCMYMCMLWEGLSHVCSSCEPQGCVTCEL